MDATHCHPCLHGFWKGMIPGYLCNIRYLDKSVYYGHWSVWLWPMVSGLVLVPVRQLCPAVERRQQHRSGPSTAPLQLQMSSCRAGHSIAEVHKCVSEYIIFIIFMMFQNQSPCITCWASRRMSSFTSLCSTSFSSPSTSASSSSSSSTCHSTSSGGEDSRETAGTSVTEFPCTSHCQNCSLWIVRTNQ